MSSIDPTQLVNTAPLWIPALTALTARLAATRLGRQIDAELKGRFRWLSDPEAKKAFFEAFSTAMTRYVDEQADSDERRAVARVLTHIAERGGGDLDQTVILEQVFRQETNRAALETVVRRYAWVLESELLSPGEVAESLTELIDDYLRPAFLATPYFTTRVGFAEIIDLLRDIRSQLGESAVDIEGLERDYRSMLAEKYEYITTQGISPRVQNRTIGIKMRDIFIPVEAVPDLPYRGLGPEPTEAWQSFVAELKASQGLDPEAEQLVSYGELGRYAQEFSAQALEVSFRVVADQKTAPYDRTLAPFDKERGVSVTDLRPLFDWEPRVSPSDFLGTRRAVIQGHPGSGKSTLTRYVAWAAAAKDPEVIGAASAEQTPIRIRAIDFGEALDRGSTATLEEYLIEEAGRFAPVAKHALLAGRAIVLVDGLDEVARADLRSRVAQCVDDFLADPIFDDTAVVVTTRIVGYERDGLLGRLPHFTLRELTDEQIARFVQAWYRAIDVSLPEAVDVAEERERLLEAISRKPSIQRMARNPLLLTIIALIKWQGRALPDLRVLLYDVAAQTLIRSWPLTQRRVELDEFLIREWLAPVAMKVFADPTSDLIDEFSLMDELIGSMQRLKPMTELEARRASRELLDSVSVHTGVLLPRGTDDDGRTLYGFLHQTFTEYFTAYYLAGKWEDGALDLGRYAKAPHWLEVLLLLAGHLGIQRREKAGRFLRDLRRESSSGYGRIVHEDLLLALRVLADGVPIGPGGYVEELLGEALEVWRSTPFRPLRRAITNLLARLGSTEYGSAVIRLARRIDLAESEVLTLAQQLGPQHFIEELRSLSKSYPGQRLHVGRLLAKAGDAQAQELLHSLAATVGSVVRIQAAAALVEIGDRRGIEALVDALSSPESLRAGDLASLTGSSIQLAPIREDLRLKSVLQNLLTEATPIRDEAARIIGLLGQFSVKDLRTLLRHPTPVIMRVLARADAEMADNLIQLLRDQDPDVRLHAVELYVQRHGGPIREEIREPLTILLDDPVPAVRYQAAARLAAHGEVRAVEVLASLLTEDAVRLRAALALHVHGDLRGTEVLRTLLRDNNALTRVEAAVELAHGSDPAAVDVLVAALDDTDSAVRLRAARTLALLRDPRAIQPLIDLAKTKAPLGSVQEILEDWKDPRVTDALLKNLAGHEGSLGRVMGIIARRADSQGIERLRDLLADPRIEVRLNAMHALLSGYHHEARSIIEDNLDRILEDIQRGHRTGTARARLEAVADATYIFIQKHVIPSE
jgi:HEAT repeat protein